MQATALKTDCCKPGVGFAPPLVKKQEAKSLFRLHLFFHLTDLLFERWIHCVSVNVSIAQSHYLKHIHEKLLKITFRRVRIRSASSSNKPWRFGLWLSLFLNWCKRWQAGSCATAQQYTTSTKKEGHCKHVLHVFMEHGIESKGLCKQGFYCFSFDTTIVQQCLSHCCFL